ncbi:MAG: DUF2089 domain-containing protein [Armatimonadetes bacterium]|nr:DUF2089 domain-containing protein [Armatimonadota bacterium]
MERQHPLFLLEEADREFVLRFVLASGSLKELAREYGVSYPTLRARLDRLIHRLNRLVEQRPVDAMSEMLAGFVERGEITLSAARAIQELNRKEYERKSEE